MKCYVHPEAEAVGTCTSCGRSICDDCTVEMQNKLVCRDCLSVGNVASTSAARSAPKDRSIAIILEIVPGLFGLFGIGWIYSGNTTAGVMWLVGMLFWGIFSVILLAVTVGIACIFTVPVQLTLLGVSAFTLNNYTKQHPELFGDA